MTAITDYPFHIYIQSAVLVHTDCSQALKIKASSPIVDDDVAELFIKSATSFSTALRIKGSSLLNIPIKIKTATKEKTFFSITDKIKIRNSDELRIAGSASTTDYFPLQIIFGDLTSSRVPCENIDNHNVFLCDSYINPDYIADVLIGDYPPTKPYSVVYKLDNANNNHPITTLTFQEDIGSSSVTCKCKGIENKEGVVLSNPADIIEYIWLNIQGYSIELLDVYALNKMRAYCQNNNISIAFILKDGTIADCLNNICKEIFAYWNITGGKMYFSTYSEVV